MSDKDFFIVIENRMVIKNVRYKNNVRLKKDIAGLLSDNWVGMKSGKDKL